MAKIYLIPTPLSPDDASASRNRDLINSLDYFVVENIRTARRFLASLKLDRAIDDMEFVELSEHTQPADVDQMLDLVVSGGRSCGVMSEAGLPCVADPGSLLVAAAHRRGVGVVPLVGGSSIMLALMASGASGQNFAFNGYLPIKPDERTAAIKRFERQAGESGQTQIFIETPYRNKALFENFLKTCSQDSILCVASDITTPNELIISRKICDWRKLNMLDIVKSPTIFILYR